MKGKVLTKEIFTSSYKLPSLSELTLEQKIAQILGIAVFTKNTWDTKNPNALEKFVANYGIGQIHLAYGNLNQTLGWMDHLQELAMQKSGIPIFFAADCEQGLPHSFKFGTELPWQMALGASDNPNYAYFAGSIAGKEARAAGIDMIYGPVSDVTTNSNNMLIMNRSFGSNPEKVAEFVENYVQGCQNYGVIATLKHFPGHGQAVEDSHVALPIDDSSLDFIEKNHLVPFIAGIKAGARAIMTGHIVMSTLDKFLPATVSSAVIYDILRKKLGYNGLVITDSMNMWAIKKFLPKKREEYAVEAILAGCDLVLHPGEYEQALNIFKRNLEQGTLSEKQLNQAVARVLAAKEWVLPYKLKQDNNETEATFQDDQRENAAQQMAASSITLLPGSSFEVLPTYSMNILNIIDNNKHDIPVSLKFSEIILQERPESQSYTISETMSEEQCQSILTQIQQSHKPIILVILCPMMWFKGRALLPPTLLQKINEATKHSEVHSTIVFGNPYIAKELPGKIKYCGYGPSVSSQKSGAEVLLGYYPAKGRLPVIWE